MDKNADNVYFCVQIVTRKFIPGCEFSNHWNIKNLA
jgi:hypothetical protein